MAARKTDWVKVKAWTPTMTLEIEGNIAGGARELLALMPLEKRMPLIEVMRADVEKALAKQAEAATSVAQDLPR